MKKILAIFAAAAAVVSCHKSDVMPDDSFGEMNFKFEIPATKATATAFESGDAVSLFAVEYAADEAPELQISGNFLNNEKLAFNGTRWEAQRKLYWSEKACDFYALYPYQSFSSIESQPFEVAADQNSAESANALGGYEASDLLFAKAEKVSRPGDNALAMNFRHIMSKCVVTITKGEKFEGDIPDDITTHIYNTCTSAILNMGKGSVEKDSQGNRKTITMKKLSNTRFEAIIVPQNIERRTPLIEVTMGGIAYLLEYSLSFKPGFVHTINLIVNTSPDQENIEISIDPNIGNMQ